MRFAALLLLAFSLFEVSAYAQADIETLIKKSEELHSQDRADEAIAQLTKAIGIQPDNADLYKRRAELYYGSGNVKLMIPDLLKSAGLAPGDRDIAFHAAVRLNWAKKYTDSLDILNTYINTGQADADIFYWRSVAKSGLQDLIGAYDDLAIAIELSPDHAGFRAAQAEIISKLGDSDKAFELYGQMIERLERRLANLKPDEDSRQIKQDLATVHYARARIFHDQGNTEAEVA